MLKAPNYWKARVAREGRFYREAPQKALKLPIIWNPHIVVLCGSARFKAEFDKAHLEETLAGKLVFTICPGIKDRKVAAKIHRQKIDVAQEILVINPGGYIGPSTKSEIAYAKKKGKLIRYWRGKA